jgi:DNA-binding GntR family transcriptional regulator
MTSGPPPEAAPLYRQLADLLEAAVLDAPEQGDRRLRLPPERQLATMFGVSRITVRAALDALALRLPLSRRVGAGIFVGPSAEDAAPWSMVRVAPKPLSVSHGRRAVRSPGDELQDQSRRLIAVARLDGVN